MLLALLRFVSPRANDADGALDALDDNELMTRFRDGNSAAFDILMRRHERGVLALIYRSVHDRDRAQDLTQDVFLRVLKTADRWQPNAKFSTWLYTIARNICIDESRRKRLRPVATLDAPIGDEAGTTHRDQLADTRARSGAVNSAREQFLTTLYAALEKLPEEQREVFVLRVIDGMKFVDIAQLHGISENTVKSRMRYATAILRTSVAAWDGFSFDDEEGDDVGGGHDR
jgi:RNA polymerase sigma-70 factor (ECF subfamily)